MKLLCIGDSNTYGYDPRSYLGSGYPEDVRWAGRLKGHEVINLGVNGMTVPRDASVFAGIIGNSQPDLVIVMLGGNDLLEGAGSEMTCERMRAFLDSVKEAGRPVLLISPPHMQPGEWVQSEALIEESKKLGPIYRGLANEEGILFADAGEWDIELVFDGVHFSPEGHKIFAENLKTILDREQDKCGFGETE